MKSTILCEVLLAGLLVTSACEQKKQESQGNTASKEVIDTTGAIPMDELQTQVMAVDERPSDVHLMTALDDFSHKNTQGAATQIQEGILALKEETARYTGQGKQAVQSAIQTLEKLKEQIEAGKLTNIGPLQNAVAQAQNTVTHNLFFAVEETFVPEKQNSTARLLTVAVAHLRQRVNKDTSSLKQEGESLLKDGENLETRLQKGEKISTTQLKDYTARCHNWLEKHNS
ncbi:hypothetical protein QNI16_20400 [Cytophagaceae bacterium YF14B1]|uniref:Lipoprotein n=1 Tax=Xanthocytophaga flava TaxID=3048013 RepID=A0AAE3QU69_9BACT|nr:hypothetical protein [Xanthocytophaga flavus]MDJ1482874.1 hypothetical protein [Xanthocytophaga flavus]